MNIIVILLVMGIGMSVVVGICIDALTGRWARAKVMTILTLIVFGIAYLYAVYYK